jgi:hypothetical protein
MAKRIRDPELELFEDTFDATLTALPERPKWEVYDTMHEDQVDGVHVLARVVGPFFAIDGRSQNNRYYSKQLWERVIKDDGVKDRLKRKKVFGTIGHDQDIDDKALREGKVSHVLSKMWIDEPSQVGMGEVYVLNTDTGRRLNTYLRAGAELPVSSRAYGKYRGKTSDGAQIVDEGSYKFETCDFVQLPGIAHAVPKLVENMQDDEEVEVQVEAQPDPNGDAVSDEPVREETPVDEATEDAAPAPVEELENQEETWMDAEVLTKLTEEKIRIETDLSRVMEERSQLTEQVSLLRSQNSMLAKQVQQYETFGTTDELTDLGRTAEKPRRGGVLPPHWCSFPWSRGPLRSVPEDAFRHKAFREKHTITRQCEREDSGDGHLAMHIWLVSTTSATIERCETLYYLQIYRLWTVTCEYRGRPWKSSCIHEELASCAHVALERVRSTTSLVGPARRHADVRDHRDAGEIGLSSLFHHPLQDVSDLRRTVFWSLHEDFVMDSANDDCPCPLERLGERHQSALNHVRCTTLDGSVVERRQPRGLRPLPPAPAQGPTLHDGQGYTDLLHISCGPLHTVLIRHHTAQPLRQVRMPACPVQHPV